MRLKLTFFVIIILNVVTCATAQWQSPDIQWQHCYGGSGNEYSFRISPTTDSGYIMIASTDSLNGDVTNLHGKADFWIVKTDKHGSIMWEKAYGSSDVDSGYCVAQTSDGGYIVCGSTSGNDGDVIGNHGGTADMWAFKLDAVGNIVWQRCYGGTGNEAAYQIIQTTEGGYMMIGYTTFNNCDVPDISSINHSDVWAVKISATGDIEWQRTYGSYGDDEGRCISQTSDGGYLIGATCGKADNGVTVHHGPDNTNDNWILKVKNNGSTQWLRVYGGSNDDVPVAVKELPDTTYIVLSYTNSNDGDIAVHYGGYDAWLLKLDILGYIQWQKTYGTNSDEKFSDLALLPGGGYAMAGYTKSDTGVYSANHGGTDAWLMQVTDSGKIQWQQLYGGPGDDAAYCVIRNYDGSYTFAGSSNNNGGDVSGQHTNGEQNDAWAVTTGVPIYTPPLSIISVIGDVGFTLSPNPASNTITVKTSSASDYSIKDVTGRQMMQGKLQNGNNTILITELPSGSYLLRSNNNTIKFVKP